MIAYGTSVRTSATRRQAGSALLMAMFVAAAMLIAMSVVVPRLVTQGRRQKEDELAWRGEQYVRAIRLYYRKYGKFPNSVDDFSKNPGNLHFLRKQYKDPMNEADGTWRYIYVGAGGQLIGSLTHKLPLGMVALTPTGAVTGSTAGAGTAGSFGGTQSSGSGSLTNLFGGQSAGQGSGQNPQQSAQQPPAADPNAPPQLDANGNPILPPPPEAPKQSDPNASINDSTVFGGQIAGVASKMDRKSIRFYKGYGKYKEWEFIWDPADDALANGQVPQTGLLPTGTQPIGTQPVGTQPVTTPPINPPQNPPQPQ